MLVSEIKKLFLNKPEETKMPVLFIGHGNPMYAITKNPFSAEWKELGKFIPIPQAILCISAHWLTKGTSVTLSDRPKTIHDFGGFPEELFKQDYPAKGATKQANLTIDSVISTKISPDLEWGYDHGTWSVLLNMYPKANIPVYQMSIDYHKPLEYHFNLGREISFLRSKGVLVIGSGNIVHNLGKIRWEENAKPFDWAIEFDSLVKQSIENNNPKPLLELNPQSKLANLAHPTIEHFLPLLYILGLRSNSDNFYFFNDSIDMGSLSMRSVILG